jgi:hypothetical protein
MSLQHPVIWPESAARRRARAVLLHVAGTDPDIVKRLAALEAVGDLQDNLPDGHVLAPTEPEAGSLHTVWRLLHDDLAGDLSVRDRIAAALAARRIKPWVAQG